MHTCDEYTKSHPQDGDSKVPRREQARFVSVSQPYAGAWHNVPGDGTGATVLESKLWVAAMQRHLGLHLSASKDALKELIEAGGAEGQDFGDHQINDANANRRHNGVLRGWYDAVAAVSTTQTVLGDKENKAKTKQFNSYNDNHVVDLAEIGGGECGEDVCNEVKCFAFAKKGDTPGKGSRGTSDTVCPATGHMIGFGNTEEECRLNNLGCRERGRPSDGPFDPKTGKGHVKKKKGDYHDAQYNKKNRVDVLLHENTSAFSPVAATKIRRLGRKARSGIDRTAYKGHRPLSYVSHHTRAISMSIVKADAWTVFHTTAKIKSELCRLREGAGRAHRGGA